LQKNIQILKGDARRIMLSLDLNLNKRYESFCLRVSCPQEGLSFEGDTQYVSSCDLCMIVPTTRIKITLLKLLHQIVTVSVGNVTVNGSITGYTIEGDRYFIGIAVSKPDRPSWKRFLGEKTWLSLHSEARQASL